MATRDLTPFSEGPAPCVSQTRQPGSPARGQEPPGRIGLYDPAHEHDACGAGFVVLPHTDAAREQVRGVFEGIVREEGQQLLGWRHVPTDDQLLGASAVAAEPRFEQVFIGCGSGFDPADPEAHARFERKLYVIRKRAEHAIDKLTATSPDARAFYIPSLSAKTLIYKGMLIADQIVPMFPDLADPDFESALALVHQRFSTNTFPSWPLAHPYRYIAHNGEINTLRGNINWMRARRPARVAAPRRGLE